MITLDNPRVVSFKHGDLSYTYTIDENKLPKGMDDLDLESLLRCMVDDLNIGFDNVDELNSGATWAFVEVSEL